MTSTEENSDLEKIVNAILKEISGIEAIYSAASRKEKRMKEAITTLQ